VYKKILASSVALFLTAGLSLVAVAAPAAAATPVVSGSAVCDPSTGTYDITWTVAADGAAEGETGTIVASSVETAPSLIGQDAAAASGVQTGMSVGSYDLSVDVLWSTDDKPVTASGSVEVVEDAACAPDEQQAAVNEEEVTEDEPTEEEPADDATCIPNSAVSYVYEPETNSGSITVPELENSTGLLCDPFWVTAASWKYTQKALWPQILDKVQKLGPITEPGTYEFAAPISCGQGDIYASYVQQPEPTDYLDASGVPFQEDMLHEMGFSGPNPTYFAQDVECASVDPTVDYRLGPCYPTGNPPEGFSSKDVLLILDNSKSTVPVTFSIPTAIDVISPLDPQPSIERTLAAGEVLEVQTNAIWNFGGGYEVFFSGVYGVTIPNQIVEIPTFTGCVVGTDPSASACGVANPEGVTFTRWIRVELDNRVVYTIDGVVVTSEYTEATAGKHTVEATGAPGYVLEPTAEESWSVNVEDTANCDLPTHPFVTPLASCNATSYTLGSPEGVLYSVNGVAGFGPGTYPVGGAQTVTVSATPDAPNYAFETGFSNPTTWTFKFSGNGACAFDPPTLAFTGEGPAGSTGLLAGAAALLTLGLGGLLVSRRRLAVVKK
jgi:hypothetical protein